MNLTSMFRHKALYWRVTGTDRYGQPEYGVPVELNVRWQDQVEEFLDKEGNTQLSEAIVFCREDLDVAGYLYLGCFDDLSDVEQATPQTVTGCWPIKQKKRRTGIDTSSKRTYFRYTL